MILFESLKHVSLRVIFRELEGSEVTKQFQHETQEFNGFLQCLHIQVGDVMSEGPGDFFAAEESSKQEQL